jgi:hypothetical protein
MKSIEFPGATLKIGKDQPEYNTLHAMPIGGPQGEVICCFELSDEEISDIVKNKRIYYSRWTFNNPFQPMRLFTKLDDGIELT